MNVLAMLLIMFTAANIFQGTESKPLFFDAVTGALNEIRKIFFGDHHEMMCRNNKECLTGNICRKNRGINFGVCVSVSVFEARRPYYPTIYRNKGPNYNNRYMSTNSLKPTTSTVQYFWGTPILENPSTKSIDPVSTVTAI